MTMKDAKIKAHPKFIIYKVYSLEIYCNICYNV